MDFTGSYGRVVDDPEEAKAIALAEAHSWRRRKANIGMANMTHAKSNSNEVGVHVVQPWYHRGMSREEANLLLQRHGTVDG